MKYLLSLLILFSLFACKQKQKHQRLADTVLEMPIDTVGELATKKGGIPAKKPKPGDTIVTPPPVIDTNAGKPKPGCLFIDFDGHTVKNTIWNVTGDFYCPASGYSNSDIQYITQKVKAYFVLFSTVKITTDSTEFLSYPVGHRQRCIVTPYYEWYGRTGGVTNLRSFNSFSDMPCFVFNSLSEGLRNTADDIAHEFGHAFGNRHQVECTDGVITNSYNWGNQQSAPIMGASFYSDTALWIIGPNALGCTSIQNDTSIIFSSLRK